MQELYNSSDFQPLAFISFKLNSEKIEDLNDIIFRTYISDSSISIEFFPRIFRTEQHNSPF